MGRVLGVIDLRHVAVFEVQTAAPLQLGAGASAQTQVVRLGRSQPLSAIEFSEIAIEGSKGKMPRLPGDIQKQAIRKAKGWFVPKVRKRHRDHVWILERETPVIQQHVYGGGAPERQAPPWRSGAARSWPSVSHTWSVSTANAGRMECCSNRTSMAAPSGCCSQRNPAEG